MRTWEKYFQRITKFNYYKMNKKQQKRLVELRAMIPGSTTATTVIDGDLSGAMRRLKKYVKDSGKIEELNRRVSYVSLSEHKRKLKQSAIHRRKKFEVNNV